MVVLLPTAIGKDDKCMIITNGAYGERMITMAKYIGINYDTYSVEYDSLPEVKEIRNILERNKGITHIAMVHCETTTGILNPI
ncbi:hypothetical protein [Clostridium botulinum]|uniref:hypothetical protein n=1 Tax=Clostridium botulinum TaxID=1491 RepID=UPI00241CDF5F|nr:hypothetical protein [Clostridium botulinum]